MGSILQTTQNTRAILTDSFRFIRSDVPNYITENEIQWLIKNNILTIVDLREESERERKKCVLIDNDIFQYHCIPVTGGDILPESVDEVSKSYIKMVDGQMNKIIHTILTSKTNVLYFCNAGKDRTGVVSAILLSKLGMSSDYIIYDYMKSKENLKNMLDTYAKQFPNVNIDVITPHEKYIREFLEWFVSEGKLI